MEYLLEFVFTKPPFLSRSSDTKIQTALFGVRYSKNPKNLKTYNFGRLFLDTQASRPCHLSPVNYSIETYRLSIRHFFFNFVLDPVTSTLCFAFQNRSLPKIQKSLFFWSSYFLLGVGRLVGGRCNWSLVGWLVVGGQLVGW